MHDFPTPEEYQPDRFDTAELNTLLNDAPNPFDITSPIDNRTAIRMYMTLARVPLKIQERIVVPWDNGFYKYSDGKSHPIRSLKLPRFLRKLHFKKDIVSVRHDWDYYTGCCSQKEADRHYYEGQKALGMRPWVARMEWLGLRAFGWRSYNRHARKRKNVPGYGTLEWIRKHRSIIQATTPSP